MAIAGRDRKGGCPESLERLMEDDQRGVFGEHMASGMHRIWNGRAVRVVAIEDPLNHGRSTLGDADHNSTAVVESSHRVFNFP